MHTRRLSLLAVALTVVVFLPDSVSKPETPHASPVSAFASLPLSFVENRGQWESAARFVARRGGLVARLEPDAMVVQLESRAQDESVRGAVVRMAFENGADHVSMIGEKRQPGHYNFFLGDEPSRWRTEVSTFASVIYRDLYDGVDLRVREGSGSVEFDVLVAPGADLGQFVVNCEGADSLRLETDGSLVVATPVGQLRLEPPISWQIDATGAEIPVGCRFDLLDDHRFAFAVPDRRMDLALVVDPVLVFSTFVGGAKADWGRAIAVDATGHTFVTGQTISTLFPSTTGAYRTSPYGADDVYVLRLAPDGKSLSYATFLGGTSGDTGWGLALDKNGSATVTGTTGSTNFPTTTGAYDTTHNGGGQDVFVTRLSPNGAALIYSTFVGGRGREWAWDIVVDSKGDATAVGHTASNDFPATSGAYDTSYNGGNDVFVAKVAANGKSLVYATYAGGSLDDQAGSVTLGSAEEALVAGNTYSTNFPTTAGAYDTTHNGGQDAFAFALTPTGNGLKWSTLLGGSKNDVGNAIAVDRSQIVVVGGRTQSTDFPTSTGAFDTTHNGNDDGFVTQLLVNGSVLGFSTFIGASRVDNVSDLQIESDGVVTAIGNTTSPGFPTTMGSYDPGFNGGWDGFVARFARNGTALRYSTVFGSNGNDNFRHGVLDGANVLTVAGNSGSVNMPVTAGAFDTTHNGGNDAIIVRMDLLPTGVKAYGTSSPGCFGPMAMDVTSMPRIGTPSWAITCTNAQPSTSGFFGLSAAGLQSPVVIMNAGIYVHPGAAFFFIFPISSDSVGAVKAALPIPVDNQLIGFKVYTQFVWARRTTPGRPTRMRGCTMRRLR